MYDRGAREAALVEAATEVFAEVGFEAATTRLVAERAQCSEGLIHRYFGGKDGLLQAVLRYRPRRSGRAPSPEIVADLERDLVAVLTADIEELYRERRFITIAISRALHDADTARFVGTQLQARSVQLLALRLQAHRDAGRIGDGHDLEAVATTLASLTFVLGFLGRGVFGTSRRHAQGVVAETAKVIAAGLGTRPKRRR
jgi:AcrR family transcriptional regulator